MTLNFTIITVTYNCADVVGGCLSSVDSQNYHGVEHVVIDGASTDSTLEVLEQHPARIISLVSEPDRGIFDALNKGIARATGDVIGLLHADDFYADNQVLKEVAAAFENPSVQAVYGDLQYVSRRDPTRVIRHWRAGEFSKEKLRRGWMPPHPALFLRRHVYERVGLFDTEYKIAADYDLMLRILSSGLTTAEIVYVPRVMVKMRLGGASNRSFGAVLTKSHEDYRILRRNGLGIAAAATTLVFKNLSKVKQFISK